METAMIRKVLLDFEIKEVSGRVLEFVGSTEMVDRDGEVILMSGWQLENYRKNPVFMWAHDYSQTPIGRTNLVHTDAAGLIFQVEFATYKFADRIYNLYKDGFIKATSVGFIPLEWEDGKDDKSPRRTYKKQELLELSGVPVPANPEALISARDQGLITVKEFEAFSSVGWVSSTDNKGPEPEQIIEALPVEHITSQRSVKDELDYMIGIISGSGLAEDTIPLAWKLVETICAKAGSDIPVNILAKVGAVLNSKNKKALKDAQNLIQTVLDSAAPEPQEESLKLDITTDQLSTYIREALAALRQPVPSKTEVLELVKGVVKSEIEKRNQH